VRSPKISVVDNVLNAIKDPSQALAASVCILAMRDLLFNPSNNKATHMRRYEARNIVSAIEFIKSEHFQSWLNAAGFKTDARVFRKKLSKYLDRHNEMIRFIDKNYHKSIIKKGCIAKEF